MDKKTQNTSLEHAEADELFQQLQFRDTDPKKAREAFFEIHRRFAPAIMTICERTVRKGNHSDIILPELVFDRTMDLIFKKAKPLKIPPEKQSPEGKQAVVLAYISIIASNEMKMVYRGGQRMMNYHYYDDIHGIEEIEPIEEHILIPDARSELIALALKTVLNDMERDVLLTYLKNENPETHRIPENLRQQLMNDHNLTEVSLRQVKHRSHRKIIKFINKTTKKRTDEESRPKRTRKTAPLRN